jgi:glycine cleavage system regulatory protein
MRNLLLVDSNLSKIDRLRDRSRDLGARADLDRSTGRSYDDPMATLVLTLVGDDRAGLVAAVADVVGAHGGNWENSRLAELAGAFAGLVEVSVPAERADDLARALSRIEGLVTVTVPGTAERPAVPSTRVALEVLGNDRPGIVREVTTTLGAHGLSIERMATETRDAAMSGGRLFEASIVAVVPASVDLGRVREELERLATEIQVDLAVTD